MDATITRSCSLTLSKKVQKSLTEWSHMSKVLSFALISRTTFLDGNISDMKFHIDTSPADLIPTLEAIDKQMLEAEEQNQFEIIKLKADSPNCTFLT